MKGHPSILKDNHITILYFRVPKSLRADLSLRDALKKFHED